MNDVAIKASNALLSDLPQAEWSRLRPHLQTVALDARTTLYGRNHAPDHVYFLQSGYVSLMVEFSDGFQIEVGGVGSDGMLGAPIVLGTKTDVGAAVVQTPTAALKVPAGPLTVWLDQLPTLKGRILRYAEVMLARCMQRAACNAHHSLQARLARSLLGIQDHIRSDAVPMTHEALALLMCAHRPSVSIAIKQLERSGLVRGTNRSLLVADRPGLEAVACECRAIMRNGGRALQEASRTPQPSANPGVTGSVLNYSD